MRLNQAFFSSSHPCGRGPQQREFHQEILQAKQVGVGAPREFHQEILQAKQAGVTTNLKRVLSHSLLPFAMYFNNYNLFVLILFFILYIL